MRPALLLALLPLVAVAGPQPHTRRELIIRLSELRAPTSPIHQVCVAGGVSTILTTPWNVSLRGTGVGERWRASFAVAFGPRRVFVTPRRPLAPGERIPFALRLDDGTAVPLFLAACAAPDGEVAVAVDTDDAAQLRIQLAVARTEAQGLAEQLRQALLERDSEDFALAGLLAGGHLGRTSLTEVRSRPLVTDERGSIDLLTCADRHDPRKVALMLVATNKGAAPMELQARGLYNRSAFTRVPFAARAVGAEIAQGATGRLALVLDPAGLPAAGDSLLLELQVRRGDARAELPVELTAEDLTPPSGWWPF